jgi:membrane associated rhomboid family serine protease
MNGELWRLLTSAFLHDTGRAWHIIMNMVLLWWFGREIESHYGHREFVAFYLVAAIAGSVAFIGSAMVGLGNTSMQTRALGASGAVTAVMVLFACHYPRHTILLFFVIPMPVWLLIAISVGLDLIGLLQVSDGIRQQRVAFAAHLGGAAFAGAYFYFRLRLTSWMGGISLKRVVGTRPNPPLRVYREEPAEMLPEPVAPSRRVDEHLEAQLDMVLEKVARLGKASLTADEQEILQRASEAYKKRRR